MGDIRINIEPDQWEVIERRTPKGTAEIWRARAESDGYIFTVFVNAQANSAWIQTPVDGFIWTADTRLVLNGLNFKKPARISKNGRRARWRPRLHFYTDTVVRVSPPPPPREPAEPVGAVEVTDIGYKARAGNSVWQNDTHWLGVIELVDVPYETELIVELDLPNGYYGDWEPDVFVTAGNIRRGYVKSLSAREELTVAVRMILPSGLTTEPQSVTMKRPTEARPSTQDWWEERAVRMEAETVHQDFDADHYDAVSGGDMNVPEDEHYRGAVPVNVKAVPSPGGFAVSWDWESGDEPVARHDRAGWMERLELKAWAVRIWYRSARLRGSGSPWRASANAKHQDARGGRVITVPVSEAVSGTEGVVDVMVQGITQHTRSLPPSHFISVAVGAVPVSLNANMKLAMNVHVFRKFPFHAPPLSTAQYGALQARLRKSRAFESAQGAQHTDARFERTGLKMRVMQESTILTTEDMRRVVQRCLPKFKFKTDNFGHFNALPEDVWDAIIEETDTDTLQYDPAGYTCANFCTDFMAAAGRLGAHALIVWDNAGGHAYIALPVADADDEGSGEVSLRYLEPQTDGEPVINPERGQYRQNAGGDVFGW